MSQCLLYYIVKIEQVQYFFFIFQGAEGEGKYKSVLRSDSYCLNVLTYTGLKHS